jgi:hypothetical protein
VSHRTREIAAGVVDIRRPQNILLAGAYVAKDSPWKFNEACWDWGCLSLALAARLEVVVAHMPRLTRSQLFMGDLLGDGVAVSPFGRTINGPDSAFPRLRELRYNDYSPASMPSIAIATQQAILRRWRFCLAE